MIGTLIDWLDEWCFPDPDERGARRSRRAIRSIRRDTDREKRRPDPNSGGGSGHGSGGDGG